VRHSGSPFSIGGRSVDGETICSLSEDIGSPVASGPK
jgi:hypothetical protein